MEFFIELLKVVIIGIVEGITEWLPVSSTGHMILVEEFLHLNVTAEFQEMFNVMIQLGAIMAVVVLYFKKLWPFQRKVKGFQGWIKRDVWDLWMKVIIAVIPAAVIGIPLDDWFTEHFHNYQVVSIMLIVYGVLFIVIENFNKHRTPSITDFSQMTWKMALAIGAFQVLSLIPGTSRSGSTILRLTSIESLMQSSHLILSRPLLLLPPIFPSIRVFSNESVLCIIGGSASASVLPMDIQD